jgi:ABC-type Co2+ transport system permease subunit
MSTPTVEVVLSSEPGPASQYDISTPMLPILHYQQDSPGHSTVMSVGNMVLTLLIGGGRSAEVHRILWGAQLIWFASWPHHGKMTHIGYYCLACGWVRKMASWKLFRFSHLFSACTLAGDGTDLRPNLFCWEWSNFVIESKAFLIFLLRLFIYWFYLYVLIVQYIGFHHHIFI